jgi:hypothetical protein
MIRGANKPGGEDARIAHPNATWFEALGRIYANAAGDVNCP